MSLADVVGCAPFRLAGPRALTDYEWSVVRTKMAAVIERVRPGVGLSGESEQLVNAIRANPCSAWTTSPFGPPPSVDQRWYMCLAYWYASFETPVRAGVRAAIATGGLLCAGQSPPWSACPEQAVFGSVGSRPYDQGGVQNTIFGTPASAEPCAGIRRRTAYAPVKGKDLVEMFKTLGPSGQLPPELVPWMGVAPGLFLERDFLLGIEVKEAGAWPPSLGFLTHPAEAAALLDELAIIWAPGQGASLLPFLSGPIDSAKLIALLQQMSPDYVAQVAGGLIGQLPGVISAYLPGIFGSPPAKLMGQPGATSAGNMLVDSPGAAIPKGPPPLPTGTQRIDIPPDGLPGARGLGAVGALALIGLGGLALFFAWIAYEELRPARTR